MDNHPITGMSDKEQAAFDAWWRKQPFLNRNPEAAWAAALKWAGEQCLRRWSKSIEQNVPADDVSKMYQRKEDA